MSFRIPANTAQDSQVTGIGAGSDGFPGSSGPFVDSTR